MDKANVQTAPTRLRDFLREEISSCKKQIKKLQDQEKEAEGLDLALVRQRIAKYTVRQLYDEEWLKDLKHRKE